MCVLRSILSLNERFPHLILSQQSQLFTHFCSTELARHQKYGFNLQMAESDGFAARNRATILPHYPMFVAKLEEWHSLVSENLVVIT